MKITYFVSKMEPKFVKNKKIKKHGITKILRRYYEDIAKVLYNKKYFIKKDTKGIIYI